MWKFLVILCFSANSRFFARSAVIDLPLGDVPQQQQPAEAATFQGYVYEKPSIPFEFPEGFQLSPEPTEVERNFVHQDLGSAHKAKQGVVHRHKKIHRLPANCDGQHDVDAYLRERSLRRPEERRLTTYSEQPQEAAYFYESATNFEIP